MIERTTEINQLTQITDAINQFVNKANDPTKPLPNAQDFSNLANILKNFNMIPLHTDPNFWQDKTLAHDESVNEAINQAISAVQAFQGMMQQNNHVGRRITEMIGIFLFQPERDKEVKKFKYNVENLKEKWKRLKFKLEGSHQTEMGKGNG